MSPSTLPSQKSPARFVRYGSPEFFSRFSFLKSPSQELKSFASSLKTRKPMSVPSPPSIETQFKCLSSSGLLPKKRVSVSFATLFPGTAFPKVTVTLGCPRIAKSMYDVLFRHLTRRAHTCLRRSGVDSRSLPNSILRSLSNLISKALWSLVKERKSYKAVRSAGTPHRQSEVRRTSVQSKTWIKSKLATSSEIPAPSPADLQPYIESPEYVRLKTLRNERSLLQVAVRFQFLIVGMLTSLRNDRRSFDEDAHLRSQPLDARELVRHAFHFVQSRFGPDRYGVDYDFKPIRDRLAQVELLTDVQFVHDTSTLPSGSF